MKIQSRDNVRNLFFFAALVLPMWGQLHVSNTRAGSFSWQNTEWLISYADGFVRRGLWGEMLFNLSRWSGLSPNLFLSTISLISFLCLAGVLVHRTRQYLPAFVIASPLLLGMNVYGGNLVRKDTLILLIFALCLSALTIRRASVKIIVLNSLSIIAILTHEAFIFFALPFLILNIAPATLFQLGNLGRNMLMLGPSLGTGALVMTHAGTPETATKITAAWNALNAAHFPEYCCYDFPPAALDAIGWTTAQGLALPLSVFTQITNGVYAPIAWALSIILLTYYLLSKWVRQPGTKPTVANNAENAFLLQFLIISPLFLAGWDFGRWIFFYVVSAVLIISHLEKSGGYVPNIIQKPKVKSRIYRFDAVMIFLFMAIPSCCWGLTSFVNSLVLGSNRIWLRWLLNESQF